MIITNIEPQKRDRQRSSVYIDGEFAFGMDNFDIFRMKLKIGQELSAEEAAHIRETAVFAKAKEQALRLASKRSYTRYAMRRKLAEKEYGEETIEKTLAFLEEYHLIDDEDYARRFVHDCIYLKKYGKYRVQQALYEKGIPRDIAERILAEFDVEEAEESNLLALAEKKLGGNFDVRNIHKTKRYLVSRGYTYEMADRAIRKITKGGEEWE